MPHLDNSTNIDGIQFQDQSSDLSTPSSGYHKLESKPTGFYGIDSSGDVYAVEVLKFTATGTATIANTGSETTLLGSGVGGLTIRANNLIAGKTIRLRARGVYSTKAASPGTLNIKIKLGSTIIIATTAITVVASLTNQPWSVEAEITCRTTGATGTVMAQGAFRHVDNASLADVIWAMTNNLSTVTIDTTGALVVDLTATWGTADTGNTISCTNATVEVLG